MAGLSTARTVRVEPLQAQAFRPFGEVIDLDGSQPTHPINAGTAQRTGDLARVDAAARGGHVAICVVRATARPLPFRLACLERHVKGTQAFVPLSASRWLVVVAPRGDAFRPEQVRAFLASGRQGVNYARGTWHHPLLAIDRPAEFLVVDRVADDGREDCEVVDLGSHDLWLHAPRSASQDGPPQ